MEQAYFDSLMAGLQDAAAFARGDTSRARVVVVEIPDPVQTHKAADSAGERPLDRLTAR